MHMHAYPEEHGLSGHIRCCHGGIQEYRNQRLILEQQQPHVVTVQEQRHIVERFAHDYEMHRSGFEACVFCAMLGWSATDRRQVSIAGPGCFMSRPDKVAQLLDVRVYHEAWPQIPLAELEASAVELPHSDGLGGTTTTKVLMHKRRVSAASLRGESPVWVCELCYAAFRGQHPKLSEFCLANWLWLGRHTPLLRDATLGSQLLLALGRVVSTKVCIQTKLYFKSCFDHVLGRSTSGNGPCTSFVILFAFSNDQLWLHAETTSHM